ASLFHAVVVVASTGLEFTEFLLFKCAALNRIALEAAPLNGAFHFYRHLAIKLIMGLFFGSGPEGGGNFADHK
ncbi:MAG TPA: hypothetical protein VK030_03915, partial [Actinomycetales bacterium]|nr:hypothetical protein [Actinomycetales bacterium]